jgi:hypothetical protein
MISEDFELGFQAAILWVSTAHGDLTRNFFLKAAGKELDELKKSVSNQEAVNRIIALMIHGSKEEEIKAPFEFGGTGFKEGNTTDFFTSPPMMYAGAAREPMRRHWKDDPNAYTPEELKKLKDEDDGERQ